MILKNSDCMKKIMTWVLLLAVLGSCFEIPVKETQAAVDISKISATAYIITTADGSWGSGGEDTIVCGAGTYSVSHTFSEPLEVGPLLAVKLPGFDEYADQVVFSDVRVWIDGKGVKVSPNYGSDGDCRIEIVNEWWQTPIPESLMDLEFYKVKVQFHISFADAETTDVSSNAPISSVVPNDIYYKVNYNANGGSGAPASQIKYDGVPLTLSSSIPSRNGYEFLGWSTSSSATTATYQSGSEYTNNSNLTLYAVWKANTYRIEYDANGGSGAPATQTKEHGKSIFLSSKEPVRTGYEFLGWSKSETATYALYSPGEEFFANEDTKLYAVWDIKKFTITYYDNGGTGAPSTQTKEYGKSIFLSKTVPMRTGYTFLGWSTDPSATTATYNTGSEYDKNSDLSLYAVWKIITYSIQYDANGGNGAPANQTKTYGIDVSISAKVPTRTGYNFMGWSKSANSTTIDYKGGAAYTENQSVTLYAVWSKKQYTITYYANGGTGAPGTQTKEHDQSIILSNIKPTREGYYFIKWCETKDGKGKSYDPGDTYYSNNSLMLYAIWGMKQDSCLETKKSDYEVSIETVYFVIGFTKKVGDGSISFKSDNNKVATVNSNGQVSIMDYGFATITITISETDKYYSDEAYVFVKVLPSKIAGFKVSAKADRVYLGWKNDTTIDGYELQYGKSLSNKKKYKIKKITKNSKQGKLIRSGKKLIGAKSDFSRGVNYFRVRSYKVVRGEKYYGAWSKKIKLKI